MASRYAVHLSLVALVIVITCEGSLAAKAKASSKEQKSCSLVGLGGCRGTNWNSEGWPRVLAESGGNLKECCQGCHATEGCTGFHVVEEKNKCLLFGHDDLVPEESLGGECFKLLTGKKSSSEKPNVNKNKREEDKTGAAAAEQVHKSDQQAEAGSTKKAKAKKSKKTRGFHSKGKDEAKLAEQKHFPLPAVDPKKKYGDSYLHLVGPGGCRGPHWSRGSWPKFMSRQTFKHCVELCQDDEDCNAIHVLRPDEKTVECLLFRNRRLITVPRLGGACYALKELPPADPQDELKVEVDDEFDGIIEPVHLGHGMCRGPKWSTKVWPILMGYKTLESCAEECAKRKKCLAFDLSKPKKDVKVKTSDCILYGHTKVKPASGVPGECYTLADRLELALAVDDDETLDEEEDAHEDEQDEKYVNQAYHYAGYGMCRGPHWQDGKWPRDMGLKTLNGCLLACKKKKACTAFDLSGKEVGGKQKCLLYHHKQPLPASGVPGRCYHIHRNAPAKGHGQKPQQDPKAGKKADDHNNNKKKVK